MNREQIIRMAREAEVLAPEGYRGTWMWGHDNLERFAALVAAAERERIITANAPEIEKANAHIKSLEDELASMMQLFTDPENQPTQYGTVTLEYMQREIDVAVEREREACAQIVDANAERCGTAIRLILESNAAAIRARGETSSRGQA